MTPEDLLIRPSRFLQGPLGFVLVFGSLFSTLAVLCTQGAGVGN